MTVYRIDFTLLLVLLDLSYLKNNYKLVAFADILICAGSKVKICSCWIKLTEINPKFDCFLRPSANLQSSWC